MSVKPPKRKDAWDKSRYQNVEQRLEQAKLDNNKLQIKIWTDVLNKLKGTK